MVPGEEGACFFRNSFSILSRSFSLLSLAISLSSSVMPDPVLPSFLNLETQWDRVLSLRPSSPAHSLIDFPSELRT